MREEGRNDRGRRRKDYFIFDCKKIFIEKLRFMFILEKSRELQRSKERKKNE